jgi:flagellar protein FliL
MLAKLFPILLLLFGIGAGGSIAYLLFPAAGPTQAQEAEIAKTPGKSEYVKLNNQFVVPVVRKDRVSSLVVLSLSLETRPGMSEAIFAREPKLRDAFLQVLFDHANMGGFQGEFTKSELLDPLRTALREVAQKEFGEDIMNVLIVGIARQDT